MSMSGLEDFLARYERLFVISGAGCSAPSGIDTYRDHTGAWQHAQPIQHQAFLADVRARQRYWARSMHGWPNFAGARPNAAHLALSSLEDAGRLSVLVTQNVDRLHQRAGHSDLIELHGSLAEVLCVSCGARIARSIVQTWLETHNSELVAAASSPAPDGDASLGGREDDAAMRIPECGHCGGILKPDVVFYGDSVPRERVALAFERLESADGVLVVGSSLMVYSSFRFCRRAHELGLPMAAVNLGTTRADQWMACKAAGDCAIVLPALLASLRESTLGQ